NTAVTAPRPGVTSRLHLSASGVSVVLDVTDGRAPAITYWGAALGVLDAAGLEAVCESAVDVVPQNAVDVPVRIGIIPQQADGCGWTPRLVTRAITVDGEPLAGSHLETGAALARFDLSDQELGLEVTVEVELLGSGLLRLRAGLTNAGTSPYRLEELSVALPV